jgi:cytosine/adenosine deaminase-related metal-dependent hydrolase
VIENGLLRVSQGKITDIGPADIGSSHETDFGDAVIIPGLINAHAHLNLTTAAGRVPFEGSFVDWLRRVMQIDPRQQDDEAVQQPINAGIAQSAAAGVTTVVDVGSGFEMANLWQQAPMNTIGLMEVVGINDRHAATLAKHRTVAGVAEFIRDRQTRGVQENDVQPFHHVGISPHAPYSCDLRTYQAAVSLANECGLTLSTHVAETREELEFLATGGGPFRQMLQNLDIADDAARLLEMSPIQLVKQAGLLDRQSLLVHANYVSAYELEMLSDGQASIVFCPRSHAFFEHADHPWKAMLERGINVCLGTDSLASNETLSILDEMKFLLNHCPEAEPTQLLAMATTHPAEALGLSGTIGSLVSGRRADFVALPVSHPETSRMLRDVVESSPPPLVTYVAGQQVDIQP